MENKRIECVRTKDGSGNTLAYSVKYQVGEPKKIIEVTVPASMLKNTADTDELKALADKMAARSLSNMKPLAPETFTREAVNAIIGNVALEEPVLAAPSVVPVASSFVMPKREDWLKIK